MTTPRENSDIAASYDLWADTYDIDPNRTRELAGEVLRQCDLRLVGRDVLEIGCGTGRNTLWLGERAENVLALDISEGMLRQAKARVQSPRVRFLQHDIRSPWPSADGSADVVIAMRSEEHTSELQSHSDLVCRLLLEKKK